MSPIALPTHRFLVCKNLPNDFIGVGHTQSVVTLNVTRSIMRSAHLSHHMLSTLQSAPILSFTGIVRSVWGWCPLSEKKIAMLVNVISVSQQSNGLKANRWRSSSAKNNVNLVYVIDRMYHLKRQVFTEEEKPVPKDTSASWSVQESEFVFLPKCNSSPLKKLLKLNDAKWWTVKRKLNKTHIEMSLDPSDCSTFGKFVPAHSRTQLIRDWVNLFANDIVFATESTQSYIIQRSSLS